MAYIRVIKSFRDLFRAWPMCRAPLEKGGPSCRENRGLPSFFFSSSLYRSSSSQRLSISGSRLGSPARMGKPLLLMFSVLLYSMMYLHILCVF